jgi:two-component system chemotaxis response regulator CheY
MKLMVVDDSNAAREQIQNVLEHQGFEIVGAAQTGVEAVQQFKLYKPHVIILDITIQLMNGVETIKRITAMDKDVRILVVSATGDKNKLIKAMRMGGSGFLSKPFQDTELIDAVDELIGGSG